MHTSGSPRQTPSLQHLRDALQGQLLTADDAGYDAARQVFYTGFDRRPAALIRAATAADVAQTVRLARALDVALAVRSGGHSPAGHSTSDGGLVLDLAHLNTLDIDVTGRTAWAGTGLTAGAYTAAVGAHGLATGFGDTASVGIGGITLGGGVGFLHRKYGLTLDHLLAAEVVTADGQIVYTDEETHPDLFWALRGGGGNFGVATRFRYRLHEVDPVVGGMLILPATPDVIVACITAAAEAPDELSGMLNVMIAPPLPFLPAEVHGRPVLMALLVYTGDEAAAARVLAPFRAPATPLVDQLRPLRYPQLYAGPEGPHPTAVAVRSLFIDTFDHATAALLLERLHASTAPMRVAQFRVLGGAVARVAPDATAFAHRQRGMMVVVAAAYERADEAPAHRVWVAGLAAALHQGAPGAYVGFLGDEGAAGARAAYPDATWERLRAIKGRYDPTNLFRLNQNIPPAEPSRAT